MKKTDKLPTLHEIINDQQDAIYSSENLPESSITNNSSEIIPEESTPKINTTNKTTSHNVNNSSKAPLTPEGNIVLEWARRKALLDFYIIKPSSK